MCSVIQSTVPAWSSYRACACMLHATTATTTITPIRTRKLCAMTTPKEKASFQQYDTQVDTKTQALDRQEGVRSRLCVRGGSVCASACTTSPRYHSPGEIIHKVLAPQSSFPIEHKQLHTSQPHQPLAVFVSPTERQIDKIKSRVCSKSGQVVGVAAIERRWTVSSPGTVFWDAGDHVQHC